MVVKRKLVVTALAEKCQALRDLENGIPNKNVAEKYGVPKNTVLTWLKNIKKNFLLSWKNIRTNAKKLGKAITQT